MTQTDDQKRHIAFEHVYVVTTTDGQEHVCPDQTTFEMCAEGELETRIAQYQELGHDDVEEFLTSVLQQPLLNTGSDVLVTAHITSARFEVLTREAVGDERDSCEHNAEIDELIDISNKVLGEEL